MRRFISLVLSISLVSATFAQAQNPGAIALSAVPAQARSSALKNSFTDLTSHLDTGGNVFVYLSTEEWLKGLSSGIAKWRDMVKGLPELSPGDKETASLAFDGITRLVRNSGVEQVSGFGMSSIAIEKDLYRVTSMLHHYRGDDAGYLWSLGGKRPHSLDGLSLMPANSAIAVYGDLDLPLFWMAVNEEIGKSGIPGAREMLQSAPEMFTLMTDGDLDKTLASLGGEYGFVLTLDDNRTLSLPIPGQPMQIPEPAAMLILKVKNDIIYDMLDKVLEDGPELVKTDRPGLKMRTMVPLPGMPPSLRPTIARSGDYLFIATNEAMVESALAVKAGGRPGLKSTDEFKRLSQGSPDQGNSFSYLSPKIGQTINKVMSQALEGAVADPAQRQTTESLMGALGGIGGSYTVASNTDEGWIVVGNTTQNPASAALLPLLAVPAMVAAVAVPSLMRSRQAAGDSAAIANLRSIVTAEVVHLVDTNTYGEMSKLIAEGLLDSKLSLPVSGYRFAITVSGRTFIATATPTAPTAGQWGYYTTEDGVIRYSLDPSLAPPGQSGKPIR